MKTLMVKYYDENNQFLYEPCYESYGEAGFKGHKEWLESHLPEGHLAIMLAYDNGELVHVEPIKRAVVLV